jgi:hypothetical protein
MNTNVFSILNSGDIGKKIGIIKERCDEEGKTDFHILENHLDISKYKWEFENVDYKNLLEIEEYTRVRSMLPDIFRKEYVSEIISPLKRLDNSCEFIKALTFVLEDMRDFLTRGDKISYTSYSSKISACSYIKDRCIHAEIENYSKDFSGEYKKIAEFLCDQEIKDLFRILFSTHGRRTDIARMLNFHFTDRKFPLDIQPKTV